MRPPRPTGGLYAWLAAVALALGGLATFGTGPATATDVFGGRTVYEAHCANCHGLDGAPVLPGTPNFTRGEGLMAPDIVLVPSLKAGKGLMPGFNHILSEKDILDVLVYTRTLQR